MDYMDKSTS